MFKPLAVQLPDSAAELITAASRPLPEEGIKNVFRVLHGYYGALFMAKFATGQVERGEDSGVANARRVWAWELRGFDDATRLLALERCQRAHPEFPPSLPQFVALCEAARPREVYRQPALTMDQGLRSKYAAQARDIIERHAQRKEAARREQEQPPAEPATVENLKLALAKAVAAAGGDEGATLVQLDRLLAPPRKDGEAA